MNIRHVVIRLARWLAAGPAIILAGCAWCRLPAIDPSGERIFLPAPAYTTTTWGPQFSGPAYPAVEPLPEPGTCGPYTPYGWDPDPFLAAPYLAPSPPGSAAPPTAPPQPLPPPGLLADETATAGGDPRGVFDARIVLNPTRLVAPVGRAVVLRAGVCDADGYFITREVIEWSLAPNSVGTIVEVDQTDKPWWRIWFRQAPRKQSGQFAVGLTSTVDQWLPTAAADVQTGAYLYRGQTWVSISSASEGTTQVSAVAPAVASWEHRHANSIIHWVDGQWVFPSPSFSSPGGSQDLVTRLQRATNGAPLAGWIVRYEITGGTVAAFDMNGSQAIEVSSDAAGLATATLIPQGNFAGTTQIAIQVIRTSTQPGDLPRLVVGEGGTSVTWTGERAPALPSEPSAPPAATPSLEAPATVAPPPVPSVTVQVTGPAIAQVDAEVVYRVRVDNSSDTPLEAVRVSSTVPTGLRYLSSSPAATVVGNQLTWELASLPPRQPHSITVSFRAEQEGLIRNCVTVMAAGGPPAEHCVTTDVQTDALAIEIRGDQTATVGERIHCDVILRNRTSRSLENVELTARFGEGLEHVAGRSPLEWSIGALAPNEARTLPLNFTVRQPGEQCYEVTATAGDGSRDTSRACVNATGPPAPGAAPRAALRVNITGPATAMVDDTVQFTVEITNSGDVPLTQVQVVNELDLNLDAVEATSGFRPDANRLIWALATLAVGQTETIRINCRCLSPSDRACATTRVNSAEVALESDESCLRISDRPAAEDALGLPSDA